TARSAPPHPSKGAPEFWQSFALETEDAISLFMENWTLAGGHAKRFANLEEVKAFIAEFCEETGAEQVLLQNQSVIAALELPEALPQTVCTVWQQGDEVQLREAAVHANVGIAA